MTLLLSHHTLNLESELKLILTLAAMCTVVVAILHARRYYGGMHCLPRIGILSLENKKEGKISIFLFVEKSFYERIIVEIIALPHAKYSVE